MMSEGDLSSLVVVGDRAPVSWGDLRGGYFSAEQLNEVRGASVLLAMPEQFDAIRALIELDGWARRIVLYPPDMAKEHMAFVAEAAETDVIVTNQPLFDLAGSRTHWMIPAGQNTVREAIDRSSEVETEWILLTSGTTGVPKLVLHTLATLARAIKKGNPTATRTVWSTFYDIRRYGGLQIFLRAALTGTSLVLPGTEESTSDFFARAATHGVNHISGTPSHWRRVLMSPAAGSLDPAYVRLSGEIADQAILNQLRSQYPNAKIAHAFASTEAGVIFEVNDGLMGFAPDALFGNSSVEMKVEGGTLRVRSNRAAFCYLGKDSRPLKDTEGFVDTGDALELRDNRYFFMGRKDGTINVGGMKVHPEEIEVVINRHPEVSMSLVRAKKNSIIGALVVADVVLKTPLRLLDDSTKNLQSDILQFCRGELALHKVPAAINFVQALAVAETGKLIRNHA
jgi:acyl-coenzyme A synthetase/AMP-(fatty) acid ligase